MSEETAYQKLIDKWVADKAVRQIEWSALLASLPSVYPSIIRDAAIKVGVWSNVRPPDPAMNGASTKSTARHLWQQRILATPHALDSCWWFTDDTLRFLSESASRLGSRGDAIALFGAPTLFHYMQSRVRNREIVLVDRIIESSSSPPKAIRADLMDLQPSLSTPASVAIVDPPWYTRETRAFLFAARVNSTLGAKILLSVPPIGTRPGVMQEWNEVITWSQGIGLRLIERRPLILRYLSPPFEVNALRAAGVPSCPADWRRGDLAIFECVQPRPNPLEAGVHCNRQSWRDIEIGRVRLKIKLDGKDEPALRLLEEIVPGNVLPTVSRRDERLQTVTLWTSGNRVFRSGAPAVLGRILDSLAANGSIGDSTSDAAAFDLGRYSQSEIELTGRTLRRIIEIEEVELEHWS